MAKNTALNKAAKSQEDEFYTEMRDITDEINFYVPFFHDKVVLCNCDDPYESNFFKYFASSFKFLKLKKLIASSYDRSPVAQTQLSLFEENKPPQERTPYRAVMVELDFEGDRIKGFQDIEHALKTREGVVKKLKGDGDFRSSECIELLKQADIVVTNPPFSLFREFVAQLIQYDKKFLILGNHNAITYKEIFPLIMQNKMWLGITNGDKSFKVPSYYEPRATRYWQDESGQKYRSLGNMCWFTNLENKKRNEEMLLVNSYYENPEKYPKYDNYDVIEVGKLSDIPRDYDGVMGVPVTFLDKYNPKQFEILGCTESEGKGFSNGLWDPSSNVAQPLIRGEKIYKRIFIRRK